MIRLQSYKHKNTIDIGFIPTLVEEVSDGFHVHGWWFLLRNENLIDQDDFFIKKDDIVNWETVPSFW